MHGTLWPFDNDATFEEIEEACRQTRVLLNTGMTIEQVKAHVYYNLLASLLKQCEWKFYALTDHPKKYHKGNCVYFLTVGDGARLLIKIGRSKKVRQRYRGLNFELMNKGWQIGHVIATAAHDDSYSLEKELHTLFNEYRIEGEYFEAAPILQWLAKRKGEEA